MWSKIKSLLTTPKVVDNVFDSEKGLLAQAGSWIGGQQFTDEERAEYLAKLADGAAAFVASSMAESTVRSQTRRMIAVSWIRVQLFLVLLVTTVAAWNIELAEFYWQLATSDLMFYGTGAVIIFFFGSHATASVLAALPQKKKP